MQDHADALIKATRAELNARLDALEASYKLYFSSFAKRSAAPAAAAAAAAAAVVVVDEEPAAAVAPKKKGKVPENWVCPGNVVTQADCKSGATEPAPSQLRFNHKMHSMCKACRKGAEADIKRMRENGELSPAPKKKAKHAPKKPEPEEVEEEQELAPAEEEQEQEAPASPIRPDDLMED